MDARTLYYSFVAGAQKVFDNQKLLNKINVFPVADADTGTNLASTMRSIVDSQIPTHDIKGTASALADAALTGARGNSGIIFAQFIYGFSNELQEYSEYTIKTFAEVIKKAVAYAYEAIANPVEGTMITVIREWAEFIYRVKDSISDFIELFSKAYDKAVEVLQATRARMEELTKSSVVDAGAKGFVVFLEGMFEFVKTGRPTQLAVQRMLDVAIENEVIAHDEITHRYCTEAMIGVPQGKTVDLADIRKAIGHQGDSMVVAGSKAKVRVHIHTDKPAMVMAELHKFGDITYQKVDDMVMQQEVVFDRKHPVAILTDSTSDLPQSFIEKHQVHVVPLSLHFGKSHFLDRLTIETDDFYKMIDMSEDYPTTAQPTYKDFFNRYAYLASHYDDIIAIHISGAMSGTFSNSSRAAHAVAEHLGKQISVFNSKSLSSGQGLIAARAVLEIESGKSADYVKENMFRWIENTEMYASAKTTKYLVKSGRLSPTKGAFSKLLGIKPVIWVNEEGKAENVAKAFGEKASRENIIARIAKELKNRKIWGYTITHAFNKPAAEWYAEKMKELTGKDPIFINSASPVLGVHAGPGVGTLSVMYED